MDFLKDGEEGFSGDGQTAHRIPMHEGRVRTIMIPPRLPAVLDAQDSDFTASTFSLGVSADLTSAMPSCREMRCALASLSPGIPIISSTRVQLKLQEPLSASLRRPLLWLRSEKQGEHIVPGHHTFQWRYKIRSPSPLSGKKKDTTQ